MPFGCVAYLCPYMEAWYSPEQMTDLRAAIATLETAHQELRTALLSESA